LREKRCQFASSGAWRADGPDGLADFPGALCLLLPDFCDWLMKKITILGSTGSIGVSTLDVIEKNPKAFKVTALAAGRNVKLLAEQIIKYKPEIASVSTREDAEKLRQILGRRKKIPIL